MKRALLLSLVAAVACGKPPLVEPRQTPAAVVAPPLAATTTPDAPFRAAPPPPLAAPDSSHRPAVTAFALTNGIRVLSAYLPGPLCAVTVAMPSYLGAKDAKPGALSLFTTSLRY